jgi:hypothetical protein
MYEKCRMEAFQPANDEVQKSYEPENGPLWTIEDIN